MNTPLLSVIVCTYNRERLLDNCLASLCKQEVDKELYEVIVVDNNSKDRTREVVSRYSRNSGNISYVSEENQGLSHARNSGCNEAHGLYLAYIDDDAVVPAEYVSSVVEVIKKYQPDIVGGPIYPYYTDTKPYWFKDDYETRKYTLQSGFSKSCRVSGGNFIIKKGVLEQIGLFDIELGMKGDEMGFCEDAKVLDVYRRVNPESEQKVYYALECHVMHRVGPEKLRFWYLMRRSFYLARSSVQSKIPMGKVSIRELIRTACRSLCGTIWYVVREIIVKGPTRVDYIVVCRGVSFVCGIVTEGVSKVVWRN